MKKQKSSTITFQTFEDQQLIISANQSLKIKGGGGDILNPPSGLEWTSDKDPDGVH